MEAPHRQGAEQEKADGADWLEFIFNVKTDKRLKRHHRHALQDLRSIELRF